MSGNNWEFWFNMTNFALGLITLLAVLVVAGAVGWELLVRKAHHSRAIKDTDLARFGTDLQALLHAGSHSLSVPELGLTMADGGERIDPAESRNVEKKSGK